MHIIQYIQPNLYICFTQIYAQNTEKMSIVKRIQRRDTPNHRTRERWWNCKKNGNDIQNQRIIQQWWNFTISGIIFKHVTAFLRLVVFRFFATICLIYSLTIKVYFLFSVIYHSKYCSSILFILCEIERIFGRIILYFFVWTV